MDFTGQCQNFSLTLRKQAEEGQPFSVQSCGCHSAKGMCVLWEVGRVYRASLWRGYTECFLQQAEHNTSPALPLAYIIQERRGRHPSNLPHLGGYSRPLLVTCYPHQNKLEPSKHKSEVPKRKSVVRDHSQVPGIQHFTVQFWTIVSIPLSSVFCLKIKKILLTLSGLQTPRSPWSFSIFLRSSLE